MPVRATSAIRVAAAAVRAPVVARYANRLSGPLRDRLDLVVPVAAVAASDLERAGSGEPSAAVRERVLAARERQVEPPAGTC